jgi:predicted metal-dependent hydrolase
MTAPRECIDYVIVHELCHLAHADHGREFRTLLEHVLPDWERRKHRLELALA